MRSNQDTIALDLSSETSFQETREDTLNKSKTSSETTPLLLHDDNQNIIRHRDYSTFSKPADIPNSDPHFKKKLIPAAIIASLHASNLGFNALGANTNTPTKNYSVEWFLNLSTMEQANAVMGALAAFGVNAIMFTRINLKAVENILKGLKESRILSSLYVFLSAYGGMPMFAIAVAGYLWAPPAVGHFFGILSYLNTAASRFTGLIDLTHSIQDQFNIDIKLQKKSLDKLKHIKKDAVLQQEIDTFLQDKPLNHHTFLELMAFLDEKGDANVFDKKTKREHLKEAAEMSADAAIAFSIALFGFILYTQKTIDGFIDFEELFRDEGFIREWDKAVQFALGFPGGILSAIFYSKNAVQIREVILDTNRIMIDAMRHFSEHKKESAAMVGSNVGLSVFNYYGGAALKSVAQGMVKNPDNIYQGILLPPADENLLLTPYTWLNQTITGFQHGLKAWLPTMGGVTATIINSVNSFTVVNHYFAPPPPEGKMSPTLNEVIAFEKNRPLREKIYTGRLAKLSMFAEAKTITPPRLMPANTQNDLVTRMGKLV